jgi:hypothetical protein
MSSRVQSIAHHPISGPKGAVKRPCGITSERNTPAIRRRALSQASRVRRPAFSGGWPNAWFAPAHR